VNNLAELKDIVRPAWYAGARCQCPDRCGRVSVLALDPALWTTGVRERNQIVVRAHLAAGFVLFDGEWYARACAEKRRADPRSSLILDGSLMARERTLQIEVDSKIAA
jgi:hypothetical protein